MWGSLLENEWFWGCRGFEVGWGLVGWPSLLKMLEPKDPTGKDRLEKGPSEVPTRKHKSLMGKTDANVLPVFPSKFTRTPNWARVRFGASFWRDKKRKVDNPPGLLVCNEVRTRWSLKTTPWFLKITFQATFSDGREQSFHNTTTVLRYSS